MPAAGAVPVAYVNIAKARSGSSRGVGEGSSTMLIMSLPEDPASAAAAAVSMMQNQSAVWVSGFGSVTPALG